MNAPVIIVAGLGRCGTSLVMQMLHAAGVPCVGEWPAFEPDLSMRRMSAADLVPIAGHALKRINPHKVGIPGNSTRTIWLDRDQNEQASSMALFARETEGLELCGNRSERRWLLAMLRRDRTLAMAEIGRRPKLMLNFEDLIAQPQAIACLIVDFIDAAPADTAKMAACVMKRVNGAEAQPTLAIEIELTRRAQEMGATA